MIQFPTAQFHDKVAPIKTTGYYCAMENQHKRLEAVIQRILATGEPNAYTISKLGKKKLFGQGVWKSEGKIAGLVEISLPLPDSLPHFDRD